MTEINTRTETGLVVSSKRDKTITVMVERKVKHPLYKKILRRSSKLQAHDQDNICSEGDLVTFIQNQSDDCDGIVINAGAITHYGLSLKDSLLDARIPLVEIHISNIHQREEYRRSSVVESVAVGQVAGFGTLGYIYALELMVNYLENGI